MEEAEEEKRSRAKTTEAARKVPSMVKRTMVGDPLRAKEERKPVAYCFLNSLNDEIIRAMDIVPAWVENYAGIIAVKREQDPFLSKAEADGYSRSLCTYATCDLGFDAIRAELGEMPPNAPWGGLAKPDMILGTGMAICEPRYKWPAVIQRYMDVPAHVLCLPLPHYGDSIKEVELYYVNYITEQLKGLVEFLEKQTRRMMDWDRLWEIIDLAERTLKVWWECLDLRKAIPTPMGTEDAMNTMVPGSFMLGTQEAFDFYLELYNEINYRVDNKIGLVPEEKYRILWGAGLPPWFALGEFDYFKSKGAVFPAEVTYRPYAYWEPFIELPKVSDPLEHLAWRWVRSATCRYEKAQKRPGSHPDVERLIEYIEDYTIDGVVMHACFSCRSWHVGLIQQLATLKKVYKDIPSLILESDMVDASSYSEAEAHAQIDTFIEIMETYK